ncbi:MAG: sigma-70 family RNA polymerase sigma factor [Microlunatus sp.]
MTLTLTTIDIEDLVHGARDGDQDCWRELIGRHQPIIDAVTRRYRLGHEDAGDVSQTVWLQLTSHLDSIREPRALPGWIKVTAEREAFRLIRVGRRTTSLEPIADFYESQTSPAELRFSSSIDDIDTELLRTEEQAAIRAGLETLNANQRDLLLMLVAEPAVPYAQISVELGLPIGSIGPTRARCLRKLHAAPSVQALLTSGDEVSLAA